MCSVFGLMLSLLIHVYLFAAFTTPSQAQAITSVTSNTHLIVRLYYGNRARLDQLASQYDVFEFADHEAGYVAARLSRAEYNALIQAGYRVEIDVEQTAAANLVTSQPSTQFTGIPSYPCYRTVEETYATLTQLATNYPGLVSLVDIGDSWDKITVGGTGYDLLALVLSNKSRPGPKPKFLLVAEFHARELTTAETATRFAEELVAGYGVDPDITWLLDYFEIHIVPMVNPDGRKKAEAGQFWRKNTDNDDGCSSTNSYGTDLNRNCSFRWGLDNGSSPSPCVEIYRGPQSFSEPESQAVRDYVRSLFPDQRGPADTDAAPTDTTGLVISLHSYAQLVLYPWGWTNTPPPNATGLETLGGKFGYFNRYTVKSTIYLYAVSGELNDWVYGELGVPCYTFELGTAFFQTCASFESTIYPSNRPALYYAAKACRQPYMDPAGPDILQPVVTPVTNAFGAPLALTAVAASGRAFGYSPLPAPANITAARYSVDNPSWTTGVVTYAMSAQDGSFNSSNETVTVTIDTTGWAPGRHTIFVEARTGTTNWGVPTAVFAHVESLHLTASLQSGGIQLRWPSVTNRLYTLRQATAPTGPFTPLATNLSAQPPTNTFTDTLQSGVRFYRLQMQP